MTRVYYFPYQKSSLFFGLFTAFTLLSTFVFAQNTEEVILRAQKDFITADSLLTAQQIPASVLYFEKSLETYDDVYADTPEQLAHVYAVVGDRMAQHQQFNLAIDYCHKAIELINSGDKTGYQQKAKLYYVVARLYQQQDLHSLAMEFYKEALLQYEHLAEAKPQRDYLLTLLQAGKLSYQLKNYNYAAELYQRAAHLLTIAYNAEISTEHALVFHNLGNSFLNLNEIDSAVHYFHKSIEITASIFGENSLETADSYRNLINAHFVNGNYEQTWHYSHKVLALYKALGAEADSMRAAYCRNQAQNHIHIRAYHTATYWYQQYFEAKYNPFVSNPILSAEEYVHVGDLFLQYSTPSHALIFYKNGLAYYEKLENHNPKTAADLAYRIGKMYWEMKLPQKAYPFYKKALQAYKFGNEVEAADCLDKLASIYKAQEQPMARISSLVEAVDMLERKNGHENKLANLLEQVATSYYEYQQYDSALYYANKLARLYEEFTDHLEKKNAYILLANIYNAKKETNLAIRFYNKVLLSEPEVFEKEVNPFTLEANQNLYNIFSHMGDYEKALKYADNAKKMRQKLSSQSPN